MTSGLINVALGGFAIFAGLTGRVLVFTHSSEALVVGGAAIAISDINHDGKLDIVAPSYSNVQSTALINQTLFRSGFE